MFISLTYRKPLVRDEGSRSKDADCKKRTIKRMIWNLHSLLAYTLMDQLPRRNRSSTLRQNYMLDDVVKMCETVRTSILVSTFHIH